MIKVADTQLLLLLLLLLLHIHSGVDLVLQVDRLPQPGETLGASSLDFFPGGKGANQAAAAAKLGWPTFLVGQLGSDSNADALQAALQDAGVQLQHVQRVPGPSGTALILLQSSGAI
jgi:ribokinase